MAKKLTEDAVRDKARDILGFKDKDGVRSGVGQLTTFNQLGFAGVADKPDGWYLPDNHADTAIVLETKASYITLGDKQVDEVLKNVKIVQEQYGNVVGILYNGDDTRVFKGEIEFQGNGSNILHNLEYYISLFNKEHIDNFFLIWSNRLCYTCVRLLKWTRESDMLYELNLTTESNVVCNQ